MYFKCGSIKDVLEVYNCIRNDDVVLWIFMVNGYVEYGYSEEVIDLFEKML